MPRFLLDNADVVDPRPGLVLPAEGAAHIGLLAPRDRGIAAFVPEERESHAAALQLPGHILEVDHSFSMDLRLFLG